MINKFSGTDLRIVDPVSKEVIYTNNYLEDYTTLYDKDGNEIKNPFQEMKHIKTFEGLFDRFKSDKNWYLKLDLNPDLFFSQSDKKYDYKGINLLLHGYVATKKSKVDPLLDVIKYISEHWHLVDNRVDLVSDYYDDDSIIDSISSKQHRLEFKISDNEEVEPNMPDDIAEEIIKYVDNKFGIQSWDDGLKSEYSSRYKENKLGRSVDQRRGWIKYTVYIKY